VLTAELQSLIEFRQFLTQCLAETEKRKQDM